MSVIQVAQSAMLTGTELQGPSTARYNLTGAVGAVGAVSSAVNAYDQV